MKRKVLLITLLLTMFSGGYALATTVNGQWNGLPIVKITSQGQPIESDSPAVILKDRTYVPLSALKSLGVQLVWDSSKYSVEVALPKPETIIKVVHELTQAQLDEIAKSVYEIFGSVDDPTKASQGSGFIIDGYMITNEHVAGSSAYTQVQIDGQWQKVSNYSFTNKTTDVMGFKVSGGNSLPYSTELPEIGAVVYAIGYPNGKLTITEGKVTSIIQDNGVTKIVSTAHIRQGASGGILLNGEGRIIGITAQHTEGTDYNYAIPIQYVQDELNKSK